MATACAVVTFVNKPAGAVTEIVAGEIASPAESWFTSSPELLRPTCAVPLVQRLAVQLQARRRFGLSMILRCLCGGIVSCNGLLASGPGTRNVLALPQDWRSNAFQREVDRVG